jgi:hypothetical protein
MQTSEIRLSYAAGGKELLSANPHSEHIQFRHANPCALASNSSSGRPVPMPPLPSLPEFARDKGRK